MISCRNSLPEENTGVQVNLNAAATLLYAAPPTQKLISYPQDSPEDNENTLLSSKIYTASKETQPAFNVIIVKLLLLKLR